MSRPRVICHMMASVDGRIATEGLAIALDASGRLIWESGEMDGEHVVAILSEGVSRTSHPFARQASRICSPAETTLTCGSC